MRTLGLLLLVSALGCGDNNGTSPPDLSAAADLSMTCNPALPNPSQCGHECDTGNSKGVGLFCRTGDDCQGTSLAHFCTTLGNDPAHPSPDDTYFCTTFCSGPTDTTTCGENAFCGCQGPMGTGTCACVHNRCLGGPTDGGATD